MENTFVSIGLPVYNGEEFLARALETLLSQTYRNFEIIISDNSSNDATESICRNYCALDSRIRYIRQINNIGAVENFKFVLSEANGNFFFWAAHDDYFNENHLATIAKELELNHLAIVAMSGIQREYHDGDIKDIIDFKGRKSLNDKSAFKLALLMARGRPYHIFIYGLFRTFYLKENFQYLPNIRNSDRLFITSVVLSAPIRSTSAITYFRTVYKKKSVDRYEMTDPALASLYDDKIKIFNDTFIMVKFLFSCRTIPFKNKLIIPFFGLFYCSFLLEARMRIIAKKILPPRVVKLIKNSFQ